MAEVSVYVAASERGRGVGLRLLRQLVAESELLAFCDRWHDNNSSYAMAYYVKHLEAAGRFADLYSTVLDTGFQQAQQRASGSIHPTLSDLRTARDNALVALGVATLMVPEVAWLRPRLQSILRVGLDDEGITFTFELPCQLLEGASRRGLDAKGVENYLSEANGKKDRWGTALRVRSARASSLHWQGRSADGNAELEAAVSCDQGFAGFMSIHLLSLASSDLLISWILG